MEQADSVAHEVTVPLNEGPAPAAWAGLQPPDNPRPLDALHNMLHEASVMSSHLRAYQPAVEAYASAGSKFFDAMRDFLASSGAAVSLSFLSVRLQAETACACAPSSLPACSPLCCRRPGAVREPPNGRRHHSSAGGRGCGNSGPGRTAVPRRRRSSGCGGSSGYGCACGRGRRQCICC